MIIRSLVVLFSMLLLDFLFPGGEVKMSLDAPAVVDAGKTFKVTVTLSKKDLSGFSRFAQDIPPGLIASSINTANADFTFKDNRVRLIWLRLPDQDTFRIIYELKVDERLKGTFELSGKFSFIDKNERKTVDLQAKQITIHPSPNIDPKLIVDIKDFKEKVIPYLIPVSEENVACVRQKPDLTYSNREILVNILVNKGSTQKFAKIEEQIPAGYTAIAMDKKDAIFAFRDQTAKFLWMTLPAEAYFTVSYKLIPQTKQRIDSLKLTGNFSYIVGQKTSIIPILEEDISMENLTKEQVSRILASLPGALMKQKTATQVAATDTTGKLTQLASNEIKSQTQTKQTSITGTSTEKTTAETKSIKSADTINQELQKRKSIQPKESSNLAYLLEPETGVYYRVQVAAGHKPVLLRKYFRRLTFNRDIKTEQNKGWFKYSIGSWNEYKQARDFRLHVWNTTPIKDAFVAAYNSGKRITVQEALMISNQKWYQ